MNKLAIAVTICSFGIAYAQSGTTAKPSGAAAKPSGASAAPSAPSGGSAMPEMTPPKPGPEQDALKPFAKSGTMTGTHVMPDGKEMPTKGKATCKWLPGGFWVACELEETSGTGKTAMKWNGHWVYGYDMASKQYRGYMTDSMGMSSRMKGTMDGTTKMVWESMDEMKVPGMPSKQRVTEELTDGGKTDKMTFEGMMNGKWMPMGSSTVKFAGGK